MAQPSLSFTRAQEAVNALQAAINAGHLYPGMSGKTSALATACKALGIPKPTLASRIEAAARLHDLHVNAPAEEPVQEVEIAPVARPRVRVKAISSADDAPVYRVFAMGDAHDGPNLPDKSRFKWMAKHAAAMKPDYCVQIGDFASFDSLSRHEAPGSLPQKLRPSYGADMESLEQALRAFHIYGDGLPLHVTLGNHEGRVKRFEAGTAEIEGALYQPMLDLFARYGWRTHDEGQYLFVGGVGFVHAPRTLLGREYAGKTLNAIANDAVFSLVFGHSHRSQILHAPKIGPGGGVTICNLGTCMPTGYVAEYAKVATHSWTYGVMELTIQAGKIIGHSFLSMEELRVRYD